MVETACRSGGTDFPVLKSKDLRAQTKWEDERHSNRKDFCSSFSENSIFFSAITFWSRNTAKTRLQWHKFKKPKHEIWKAKISELSHNWKTRDTAFESISILVFGKTHKKILRSHFGLEIDQLSEPNELNWQEALKCESVSLLQF